MRLTAATSSLLALLALALPSVTLAARPKNAILLSEVQSLTLHAPHQKTTSRRVPPIPQLQCLSPRALCNRAAIQTMRCTNQGSSYTSQDIEWACTANVPAGIELDRTEVVCEGYASADDAYVLRGSCGVRYTLRAVKGAGQGGEGGGYGGDGEMGGWAVVLFWMVFAAVFMWILVAIMDSDTGTTRGGGGGGWRPGWGGGGGGGGGWGRGDDAPPPYPGSGPEPKPKPSSSSGGGWTPGFWTGLASGAAAGYTAGNRGQRSNNSRYNDRDYPRSSWGSGSGFGGSGESSSSASSSGSGTRHESTGFGSTSRR